MVCTSYVGIIMPLIMNILRNRCIKMGLEEDLNSMDKFADFYEKIGNIKMRDYYFKEKI